MIQIVGNGTIVPNMTIRKCGNLGMVEHCGFYDNAPLAAAVRALAVSIFAFVLMFSSHNHSPHQYAPHCSVARSLWAGLLFWAFI